MAFKQRLLVTGALAAIALAAYAAARYYSPPLVTYVVEQALLQKSPPGSEARERFRALIAGIPDRDARLQRLLSLSQYLEKFQLLTPQQIERMLAGEDGAP